MQVAESEPPQADSAGPPPSLPRLADGRAVLLRAVHPADRGALLELHAELSDESRFLRYHSAHRWLSEHELEHFSNVDQRDHSGLLAFVGGHLAGHALYDRSAEDPDEAEVALEVADAHQGQGLGTLLLEELASIARGAGVHRFTARVLSCNRRMFAVFRDLGFAKHSAYEDGVVLVRVDLDDLAGFERAHRRRAWAATKHSGEETT
jgi:RimJ/RimL family protein N-acetyltransferase